MTRDHALDDHKLILRQATGQFGTVRLMGLTQRKRKTTMVTIALKTSLIAAGLALALATPAIAQDETNPKDVPACSATVTDHCMSHGHMGRHMMGMHHHRHHHMRHHRHHKMHKGM
jgi:hypothetical protein